MKNVFVQIYTVLILSSCSSFPFFKNKEFRGGESSSRSFQVQRIWTQSSQKEPLKVFRQMNRSAPVLYSSSSNKSYLLFGNPYNGVQAFRAEDGKKIWSFSFKFGTETKIRIEGDYAFIAANDGFIYCLEAETGKLVWSFPTRTENTAEIFVHKGLAYVLTSQNTIFALEAATGERSWIYTRPDSSLFTIRGSSRPTILGDTLYVGFGDGALIAFDKSNGKILWERTFSSNKRFRDIDSDLLVEEGALYVGGFDDAVYALNPTSGQTLWVYESGVYGAFALSGKNLCFASPISKMICLNKSSGEHFFSYEVKPSGIPSSPLFYKGLLVFGSFDGPLVGIDINLNKEVFRFTSGRGLIAPILSDESNHRIYMVSNESYLYALEAKWDKKQKKVWGF